MSLLFLLGGEAGGGGGYTPPSQLTGVGMGQSNEDYKWKAGDPNVAVTTAEVLRDLMGYTPPRPMQLFSAGSDVEVASDSSTKYATNHTVRYINWANGGASLVGRNTNALGGNYYWNHEDNSSLTGDPTDTAGTPGPLLKKFYTEWQNYSGTLDFIEWSQGESDASYVNTSEANRQVYEDTFELMVAHVAAFLGYEVPWFICHIGRGNRAASFQALKDTQYINAKNNPLVHISVQQYPNRYATARVISATANNTTTLASASASTSNTGQNMCVHGPGITDFSYIASPPTDGVSFVMDATVAATGTADYSVDDDTHYEPDVGGLDAAPNDTTRGLYNIGRGSMSSVARYFLRTHGDRKVFGPKVASIAAPIGGDKVYLNIEHDLGDDLTCLLGSISSACAPQFRIENPTGTLKTITDVQKLAPTTIELTLSSTVAVGASSAYVGFSSMNRTDYRLFITDNATYPMALIQGSPTMEPDVFAFTPGDAQPINTLAPVFVGDAAGTVTLLDGTWTGSASFTYAYDYEVNDVAVSGSTNSFDVSTLADGDVLTGFVTATNSEGSTRVPCVNPITVATRNATIASVSSSAVFDLDATIGTSSNGIEQYWRNMISTPADGSARGDYDYFRGASASASTDDPTFTGSVDNPAAYWLHDGGDYYVKAAANTNFLRDLHKTTGASPFTIAISFKFVSNAAIQAFFATASATSDHGFYLYTGTTGRLTMGQVNGSAAATTTATDAVANGDECLLVITGDFSGTVTTATQFINSLTPETRTLSKGTTTTNASFAARISARGSSSSKPPSGTRLYNVSGYNSILSDEEVATHYALMRFRHERAYAVATGPFPLDDDGLGYTIKLTLPVNEDMELSGQTDAYEVFTSNSPNYTALDPTLEDYSHPTYFVPHVNGYRFSSPIRPGAYTSSNTNGPARSELRHERNYGPTERIRFISKIKYVFGNPSSKCTCVQIHRLNGDPVIKGVLQVDGGGTTWKFRALVKLTDGADDESFDDGLGGEVLAENLTFNTEYSIECDFDPVAETLKVWFNTANTNAPTHTFSNVEASGLDSYIKPGGVYPSDNGTGNDDDLWTVDLTGFDLVDNSGNLVVR